MSRTHAPAHAEALEAWAAHARPLMLRLSKHEPRYHSAHPSTALRVSGKEAPEPALMLRLSKHGPHTRTRSC